MERTKENMKKEYPKPPASVKTNDIEMKQVDLTTNDFEDMPSTESETIQIVL